MHFERLASIAALVISISALVVSIWQGYVSREHNILSTKPYIQVHPVLTGDTSVDRIELANDGMGTAFIESVILSSSQGLEYDFSENNWEPFLNSHSINPECFQNRWFKSGAAMKPGDSVYFVEGSGGSVSGCVVEFLKLLTLDGMHLRVEYESVYGINYYYDSDIFITKSDLGHHGNLLDMIKKKSSKTNKKIRK